MLSLPGVSCKGYAELEVIPELTCPDPACQGSRLQGHGSYNRRLDGELQPLRRVRCPRCGVSHALFPEDLCSYRDAKFGAVEAALSVGSPSAGAEAAEQFDPQGVRRVRRWLRSAEEAWASSLLALLPAAEGRWWERAQTAFGAGAGWLTRLRHDLWSRFRCFVGGVFGLYRDGRPGYPWSRQPTNLGNCSSERACDKNSPVGSGMVSEPSEEDFQHG
jgi:hypothetical protein